MGIKAYGIKDWWATGKPDITQASWDTWEKDHRLTLPLAIEEIGATAVFEIGCGPGPNFRLLRSRHPNIVIGGSDINPREIEFLKAQFDGDFTVRPAPHEIPASYDALLSCFTMAYMYPGAVKQQLRLTKTRWLVLIEPWGEDQLFMGIEEDVSPMWHHDWWSMTRATGWQLRYRWPIAKVDYLTVLAIYENQHSG